MPNGLAVSPDGSFYVVVTIAEIFLVVSDGKIIFRKKPGYCPISVAISPDGKTAAVGGEDNKVHLYAISEISLDENGTLDNGRGAVNALAFSPDGSLLAAGDSDRKVLCYEVASKTVTCLAWSEDGKHVASGSLDTYVYIWSVEKPMKNIAIRGAHLGEVTGVAWRGNTTVVSAGADACVKVWDITFHQ
ncbi:MAG: putative WD-repeat protein [Olpidium bornovanus]|uniref:WD-repeat protein n=1 Tax=Olpidium bornovanus TaxID=278681 RepID=A0A8H8DF02_9FUNG|nr:MAG: putative WD-repeat protein [Olpidium bornovanus]